MTGKTYLNEISEQNVSLAIQQILVGDYGSSWTPGRVDVDNPPTGFHHLGAIVEDTPQVTLRRGKFELKTGIPQVLQYQAVTALDGMLSAHLHSFSWRQMQFALGQITYTCSPTAIASIASIGQNYVTVAQTTGLTTLAPAGRGIVVTFGAQTADDVDAFETVITSVTSDRMTFTIDPIFPTTVTSMASGYNSVSFYSYQRTAGGLSRIKKYRLLAVADFINGIQVVHDFQKATTGEEIQEEIRPAANPRIPITFNAHGYRTANYPQISTAELVVFERYFFPTGS